MNGWVLLDEVSHGQSELGIDETPYHDNYGYCM